MSIRRYAGLLRIEYETRLTLTILQADSSEDDIDSGYLYRTGPHAAKEVERGFVSRAIRNPEGAAAYDLGREGWEDFLQRARLGKDINPQIQELEVASTEAHAERALQSLLHAANVISEQDVSSKLQYDGAANLPAFPKALSALADAALAEPMQLPQIRTDPNIPSPHRAILPQPPPPMMGHGPTDPRSFILPRPTPTQQPRLLLPARGLPDPFTMNGPPQLPPPPGSNFQPLPMPGFLQPVGPPSMYFPLHGHPPPPPPPPPPSSRRY